MELGRAEFYGRIRDHFPTLHVPRASEGEAPALQPYRFLTEDETRWVGLAVNSLSYSVKGALYGSFVEFSKGFLDRLSTLLEVVPSVADRGMTRVGLRYQNHIPVQRDANGDIEDVPLNLPDAGVGGGRVRNLLHVSEHPLEDGMIRIIIDTTQDELAPEFALFDMDAMVSRDLSNVIPFGRIKHVLETSHAEAKKALSAMLDARYVEETGLS